ncbi:hypothetical protein H5410_002361 [Solanum commersonii]|uniref:DUF7746 domain-containing protein n=1 Tax=Solanum commersonii TaxID=4109 RepID=A0A9J6B1W5_SOLCO|nr:hypothetical protein H5410_002361 [Solanum commersonii]
MYNTICKTNKNSDKTIADMINAGFTGQLKGWWDNYLNQDQRDKILQAIKQEGEQYTQNTVYTLVLNIIEHFSGRWSENNGLPTLFAERVRKFLRGDNTSINYEDYNYEKLISAYIQEGLSLRNEIKLNQQIKRHRLNERQQLEKFCEQFVFDIPKQKSKDKEYTPKKKKSSKKIMINGRKRELKRSLEELKKEKETLLKEGKSIDIIIRGLILATNVEDDNIKDSLYKIILNSNSGRSESNDNSSEESSTSEDLKALQQEDYMTSEDECSPCQQGLQCEKEEEEDDLYKIYSQFKELSLNVINNDNVLDLLKNIKDLEVRTQIIDRISNPTIRKKKDYIPEEIPTKDGSYTMAEVKNVLLERRKIISSPTTINDLKEEINNLKEDIVRLKERMT